MHFLIFLISFDLYNVKILILDNNINIESVHSQIHRMIVKCAIVF